MVNCFELLTNRKCSTCECDSTVGVDVQVVSNKIKILGDKMKQGRRLRVATWNFSGLCSERKQKEVGELLVENNMDIVAGQESWEKENRS